MRRRSEDNTAKKEEACERGEDGISGDLEIGEDALDCAGEEDRDEQDDEDAETLFDDAADVTVEVDDPD